MRSPTPSSAARLVVLTLAAALSVAGCGGSEEPRPAAGEKLADGSDSGGNRSGSRNGKRPPGMKGAKGGPGKQARVGSAAKELRPPATDEPGGGPGGRKPGAPPPETVPEKDIPGQPPRPPIKNGKPVPHAIVTDLAGDQEGEGTSPAYMDLRHVQLERHGDQMLATLRFNGALPKRMPDEETSMLTSIDVKRGGEEASIYAEATSSGWRAHSDKTDEFPGTLSVRGNTLTLTFPVGLTGKKFQWYSHSSWTRSTLLETQYFFDFAPDDQKGKFPSREIR